MEKLQRMLVRRIRNEVRSVDLPFRCDGPEVRREMDINISATPSGRFVLFSARLRAAQRRQQTQPLLVPSTPRSNEVLTMCGWCDRFLVGGEWVDIEDAVAELGLFRLSELPALSHGICPVCSEMLMAA